MLDARQQFKAAFIMRCIENGYTTPEEITGQVKEAREKLALSTALGSLISAGTGLGTAALGLAAAAPPVAGFLAGNSLGQANDLNDIDAAEVKKQELIDELRKQTERIRRKQVGNTALR